MLIRELGDCSRVLAALAALSTAQLELTPAEPWDDILHKKQRLLDALETVDIAQLRQRAEELTVQLRTAGCAEQQSALRAAIEQVAERLVNIARSESAAQKMLEQQSTELQGKLLQYSRSRQARQAYRPAQPGVPPARYMDGRR